MSPTTVGAMDEREPEDPVWWVAFREAKGWGWGDMAASIYASDPRYLLYSQFVHPYAYMAAATSTLTPIGLINDRLIGEGYDPGIMPLANWKPERHDDEDDFERRIRERQRNDPYGVEEAEYEPETEPEPRLVTQAALGRRPRAPEGHVDRSEHASSRWAATHNLHKHSPTRHSQTRSGTRERNLRRWAAEEMVSIAEAARRHPQRQARKPKPE
jgi:hypothetical protein